MLRVGEHTVFQSSIGASPLFSGAERYFRTESASPWVAGAASSGSRKEELVERNASVALKTAVTEIRVHEQHEQHEPSYVGAWGWGWGRRCCKGNLIPPGTPGCNEDPPSVSVRELVA